MGYKLVQPIRNIVKGLLIGLIIDQHRPLGSVIDPAQRWTGKYTAQCKDEKKLTK